MFERCEELLEENAALEAEMADPALHADPKKARKVGRRHAELRPVIETYREWLTIGEDLIAAKELGESDPAFAQEAQALEESRSEVAERLTELLIPRDPLAGSDVILEIKAGEGGDESALFAADLWRMYQR